uniref:Uncharacterized protein n=1 Tax=Anguilla anguilla TaxID=7936 RepID=A0A0E9SU83_ANGAN
MGFIYSYYMDLHTSALFLMSNQIDTHHTYTDAHR